MRPGAIAAAKPGAILLADAAACAIRNSANGCRRISLAGADRSGDRLRGETRTSPIARRCRSAPDEKSEFVRARLSAALRRRTLHGSVLRRAATARQRWHDPLPDVPRNDPLDDATVIVAGRGTRLSRAFSRHR
jgi:hypothetical protein